LSSWTLYTGIIEFLDVNEGEQHPCDVRAGVPQEETTYCEIIEPFTIMGVVGLTPFPITNWSPPGEIPTSAVKGKQVRTDPLCRTSRAVRYCRTMPTAVATNHAWELGRTRHAAGSENTELCSMRSWYQLTQVNSLQTSMAADSSVWAIVHKPHPADQPVVEPAI
jgi:hypothetical protein